MIDLQEFATITEQAVTNHLPVSYPVVSLTGAWVDEKCEPFQKNESDQWMAGCWVGYLSLGDCRVSIQPRVGWERFEMLVAGSMEITYVGRNANGTDGSEHGITRNILALLWCLALKQGRRVHHGPVKAYVQRYEPELPSLRGQLDLRRQLTVNQRYGKAHRFACRFDELSHDIPINRGILAVIERLRREKLYPFQSGRHFLTATHRENLIGWQQRLQELGVSMPNGFPTESVHWSRTNGGYRKAHHLGGRRVHSRSASVHAAVKGDSLLFDSAEIWELFLYHRLQMALEKLNPAYEIHSPRFAGEKDYLFEYQSTRRRGLVPDFILREKSDPKNALAILDAKYRYFQGLPKDDEIQQMALYACRYGKEQPLPCVLIYPTCPNFNEEKDSGHGHLLIHRNGSQLHWWLIDLGSEKNDPETRLQALDDQMRKALGKLIQQMEKKESAGKAVGLRRKESEPLSAEIPRE